jgi:hypothetical protein
MKEKRIKIYYIAAMVDSEPARGGYFKRSYDGCGHEHSTVVEAYQCGERKILFHGEYWLVCRVEEDLDDPDIKKFVEKDDFTEEEDNELGMFLEDSIEF